MAMYQVDGWEGLVPFADLQNYLDTAQLYADNWVCEVPDLNSLGWITLGDALLPAKKIVDFADGTRVEGLYSDGTWYPGTVQGKNPSGSFLVAFDAYAGYPPEPCSEIRLEGSDTAKATTPTPVEAAPVAPVAPVAPLPTPTTSSTTEKVWHILAGESGETTGPFSIDELSEQLRDGLALTNTSMIHETGTEWVTVGSVATAAPAASSAGSAKQFAAAQTRKKQGGHVRKVSKVTVFQQPPRKKSIERTGSRSAPVKSGSSTYGGDKNKYDEDGAMVICQWIESIIDRPLAGSAAEFIEVLQNECTIFSELFGAFGQGKIYLSSYINLFIFCYYNYFIVVKNLKR